MHKRWIVGILGALLLMPVIVRAAPTTPDVPATPDARPLDANGFRKASDSERKAASTVIETQLKAFQNDDYATAEKYQASGLKENFASRDTFRKMMKEHYPQFANYKSVTFGDARADEKGEVIEIQATVTGKDKVVIKAVYVMVKEEGGYRVASVFTPPQRKPDPRDVI